MSMNPRPGSFAGGQKLQSPLFAKFTLALAALLPALLAAAPAQAQVTSARPA